jgi:hypothetical protein
VAGSIDPDIGGEWSGPSVQTLGLNPALLIFEQRLYLAF